jgi:hypothetical protein
MALPASETHGQRKNIQVLNVKSTCSESRQKIITPEDVRYPSG